MEQDRPLTKTEKRRQIRENRNEDLALQLQFNLKNIVPITKTQHQVFESYKSKNLLLHGYAGTGKSFISLYLALKELFQNSEYKKIIIVKSIVPVRDIGFLPGNIKEKIEKYEDPYRSIFKKLFKREDSYDYLKGRQLLEFIPTSFIRGLTFTDSIIIVDEIQNMNWGELSSIVTRLGNNCKIVFCGDYRQSDFNFKEKSNKKDVHDFMGVIERMTEHFKLIEFKENDIVRSQLVRDFIITANDLGMYDINT